MACMVWPMEGMVVVSRALMPTRCGWWVWMAVNEVVWGSDINTQIDNFKAGAFEHHAYKIFADVVHVAFDGAEYDFSDGLDVGGDEKRP